MRRNAAGGARAMQTSPEEILICTTCPLTDGCHPTSALCPLNIAAKARKEAGREYARQYYWRKKAARADHA